MVIFLKKNQSASCTHQCVVPSVFLVFTYFPHFSRLSFFSVFPFSSFVYELAVLPGDFQKAPWRWWWKEESTNPSAGSSPPPSPRHRRTSTGGATPRWTTSPGTSNSSGPGCRPLLSRASYGAVGPPFGRGGAVDEWRDGKAVPRNGLTPGADSRAR